MLQITIELLKTNNPQKVTQMLINSGMSSLEAAQLVIKAMEAPKAKVEMEKIIILWSEAFCEENLVFDSWQSTNKKLKEISDMTSSSYTKTKFQVHWQDGNVYEGRLDIEANGFDTNIGQHMIDFLKFYSGQHCPKGMSSGQYKQHLAIFSKKDMDDNKSYLEKYNIIV